MMLRELLDVSLDGDGPNTLVFGNGFSTTQQSWDTLRPTLPGGWRVVRFDYVGTTPQSDEHWIGARYESYAGHADDLVRLLREIDAGAVVFVGHSMSGMVGLLAAIQAPEHFRHLVMIGASPCYRREEDYDGGFSGDEIAELLVRANADLAAWMGGFAPAVLGADASPSQLRTYLETLLAMRPDISRTLIRSIFLSDYRRILAEVRTDVTIVQGRHDVAVPVSVGKYLAAQLPCAGYHELEVPGHLPHVTHPTLVAPILDRVLRTVAPQAPTG